MASKRSAATAASSRPAKKRPGKVPPVLSEALAALPQPQFIKLVKTHVFPGIDDSLFQPIFRQAIDLFKAKDDIDQLISFKKHQQELDRLAKDLKSSLRHDWHDGYGRQWESKCEIILEVTEWLNNLFKVAVEQGLELLTVQKCLIFMEKHILAIINDNCRTDYSESVHKCEINDSTGAARYEATPDELIPLFWRDLLLTAIIQDDQDLLTNFKAHTNGSSDEGVTDILAYIPGPEAKKRCKHSGSKDLFDSWHSDEMKAAVPQLRSFLQE